MLKQQGLSPEGLHVAEMMGIGVSETTIRQTEHDLASINTALAVNATSVAYKVKSSVLYNLWDGTFEE